MLTNKEIDEIEGYLERTRDFNNNPDLDVESYNEMLQQPGTIDYQSPKKHCKRQQLSYVKRLRTFNKYHGCCHYCGKKLNVDNFHVDHMNPLSRGGTNDENNLALACPKCNESKGNLTEHEYLEKIGDPRRYGKTD